MVTLSLWNIWKEKLHVDQKYLKDQFDIYIEIFFLSDSVMTLLNLFVFGSIAWQISLNWSSLRNGGFDLERAQTSEHCYRLHCQFLVNETKTYAANTQSWTLELNTTHKFKLSHLWTQTAIWQQNNAILT